LGKLLKESLKSDGEEEFEDTKGVTKIRQSKKNRQYNDQKKKYQRPILPIPTKRTITSPRKSLKIKKSSLTLDVRQCSQNKNVAINFSAHDA
jgi:hypothetical protein